jgi:hypothetical protein
MQSALQAPRLDPRRWIRVLAVGALALLPPALQASDREPSRCIARWQGPGQGCTLVQAITAEGLGGSERTARKAALRNLAMAAEAARIHKASTLPAGARALFLDASGSCGEAAVESAITTCFPEPHLRNARYCWLEIELDLCSQSQGFFLDTKAWYRGEETRGKICGELPDDPFGDDTVDERSAACQSACWQQGKLSCGAARR